MRKKNKTNSGVNIQSPGLQVVIRKMTGWQNHQYLKALRRLFKKNPDRFAGPNFNHIEFAKEFLQLKRIKQQNKRKGHRKAALGIGRCLCRTPTHKQIMNQASSDFNTFSRTPSDISGPESVAGKKRQKTIKACTENNNQ